MNKKLVLSGILGLSLVLGGYFMFKGEEKSKARVEHGNEFDIGPDVVDPNAANDWEVEGKPFYGVVVKKTEQPLKENEVMINGVKYEKIKGYLLPPEPDPEENKKGLLGVDVNNNYVRDDLERRYFDYYSNKQLKNQFGVTMMIARSIQLHMLKNNGEYDKPLLDFHGLYMKAKGSMGVGMGDGVPKAIGNTPERKMKLPGIGGGVYESFFPNRFTRYAYKDFSFDNEDNNDFSGYKVHMDYYDDKPFPVFSPSGAINGLYYKGKSKDIRGKKFCLLNASTEDRKECKKVGQKRIENFERIRRNNNYKAERELIQRILKETMERYNEGSWNE